MAIEVSSCLTLGRKPLGGKDATRSLGSGLLKTRRSPPDTRLVLTDLACHELLYAATDCRPEGSAALVAHGHFSGELRLPGHPPDSAEGFGHQPAPV
jgi:hypothetical protein